MLPSPSLQIADRWTSFSRILVWFCGFYPNIFSKEKEKEKRRDVARKRCRQNPAFSLHKKSRSYRYWNRRSFQQNCFTVTCETERWCGGKKGQVMLGDTVDIIVSSFITLLERLSFSGAAKHIINPLPATSDRFARFSGGDLAFTWWEMSISLRGRCWNPRSTKWTRKKRNTRAYFMTNLPSVNSKMKGN